ncbi:nitrate- and nitrite sensing domain-containing protein [Kibdelosporangium aridum]|uniref:sensor histidine kinase n=1 Tax=Kibdelosporangium aridum TaxID=2030 RepID=UPI00068D7706|nr:nitrate- and nitrite sensing domain-containing protein [Kibdelosporangium aridum]
MSDGDAPGGEGDRRLVYRLLAPRTIRYRLVRILLVSVALVLVLLGLIIVGRYSDYAEAEDTEKAVSLALAVQSLAQELQRERDVTYGKPDGATGRSDGATGRSDGESRFTPSIESIESIGRQRKNTDRALAELHTAVAAGDSRAAGGVRGALGRLDAVLSTRRNVDAGLAGRSATFEWYTAGIAALNEVEPGMGQARDAELREGLRALSALGAATQATAQERGFLAGVFAAGRFRAGEYIRFTEIRAVKLAGLAAFRHDATLARRAQLEASLESQSAVQAAAAERAAISSPVGPIAHPVDPVGWWAQMTSVVDQMWHVQRALGEDLRQRARDLRTDAASGLMVFLLLAVFAVGLQIALVVGCLRSIVRPLAALAAQAHDIATRRLPAAAAAWHAPGADAPTPPQPVRAPTRAATEIASAARAVDRVQSTAFALAGEQALVRRTTTESLANLGRRNQDLVCRQLGLISEFERHEPNPTALAKLFELDHLATRMRRNTESLLVLAGEPSPPCGAQPLAITDVIRAGISGVEDYRRVALRQIDEAHVTGPVVGALAHLLAELIDNALSFSPPHLEVEIHGARAGVRYALTVVDHGAGMPHEQLATANARLRGEQDVTVTPTQSVGHHVAGRLAHQLGVEVELTQTPVSGITAQLLLPQTMLADPPAARPEHDNKQTGQHRRPATQTSTPADTSSATGTATTPDAPHEHLAAGPAITQIPRNNPVKRTPKRHTGDSRPAPARPAPSSRTMDNRSPDETHPTPQKARTALQNNTTDNHTTTKDESQ